MTSSEGAGANGPGGQILVFTYHKTGTVLFEHVMGRVAQRCGLRIVTRYGFVPALEPQPDIVMLAHSMLGSIPQHPFRGVRIVRDPRDIWVSSYLYHRHCREGWCTNVPRPITGRIGYPQVDFAMAHRSEDWKRAYLQGLDGRSYQQNLLARDAASGLAFELAGYTGVTLDALLAWVPTPGVLTVKLETIAAGFDAALAQIFRHLGFDDDRCCDLVGICAAEDVARMDEAAIAANPHIHGRTLSKWRDVLTEDQVARFERQYGDLIRALGYETLSDAG